MIQQLVAFKFDDNDLEDINRLKAEGFEFATITMRDKRGFERAFVVWVPPAGSSSSDGVKHE
jgi:hypothetical protein